MAIPLVLLAPAVCAQRSPASARSEPLTTPFSVQMHVHGSFSEGVGSMSYHTHEARAANVDVIWWSDHDFRVACYHIAHATTFSFEGWEEPLDYNEPWTANRRAEAEQTKRWELYTKQGYAAYAADMTDARSYEGSGSFRLEGAAAGADFRPLYYFYGGNARKASTFSLAAVVSVELAIFPEVAGPDARAGVEVELSEHPDNAQLPQEQYRLHYYLDNSGTAPYREGATYHVPLPYVENEWNCYSLPLTSDAVAGFPFIDGEDNSICLFAAGIETRNGSSGVAYFDALRINLQTIGAPLFAKQRTMLGQLETAIPEVRQLQGQELSYISTWHLNEFSVDTELPDFDEIGELSGLVDDNGWITHPDAYKAFLVQYLVDAAHARGGVVSYNHMFGTPGPHAPPTMTKEQVLWMVLVDRAHGADVLEVGYRARGGHDLTDHLWVWDELAKRQLLLIGNGVSDYHGGGGGAGDPGGWLNIENNFVSWIYAADAGKPALIDGLKRGRVFFGDISRFDGSVELITDKGHRMGQIVLTDSQAESVTIQICGLNPGQQVRLVERGVTTAIYDVAGSTFEQTELLQIDPLFGTFVRVEVYEPDGREVVFSNPIHFVRQVPGGGVDHHRAAIDLAGIHSVAMDSFRLFGGSGNDCQLTLDGAGAGGTLALDHAARGPIEGVQFEGIAGDWADDGDTLVLSNLNGQGRIEVLLECLYSTGDLNCDGAVDSEDITPFMLALGAPLEYAQQYPDCEILLGDINADGGLDTEDIDPFFLCLAAGGCP